MHYLRVFAFVLLLSLSLSTPAICADPGDMRLPDELIVQINQGANDAAATSAIKDTGCAVIREIPQIRVKVIKTPGGSNGAVKDALSRNPAFSFVEYNYLAKPGLVPNDPDYASEDFTGRVSAPQAWDINTGSPSVIIAVIDSGVDPTHPDLMAKLMPGYNFLLNNTDTHDTMPDGHGTSVAGVCAAGTDNLTGVAGICWGARIMPLSVFDPNNHASYSDIANAITYAADNGARVMNISIYGTQKSRVLQDAVDYAWNKGSVIFACAGNDSTSTPAYPAACNYVVGVAAMDNLDRLSSFSNYGTWIKVSAPGEGLYTTKNGGGYWSFSGTSAASPVAAGIAALILSANPSLTPEQVVATIENSADDIGSNGFDETSGYGRVNAYRSLIAAANIATFPDTEPPTVLVEYPQAGGTLSGQAIVGLFDTDNVGVVKAELYINGVLYGSGTVKPFNFYWNTSAYPNGAYDLSAVAYDAAGNIGTTATSTVYIDNFVDTVPPYGSITSPLDGVNVSGSVTITANYNDFTGFDKIELYIDGILKTSVTTKTLSYTWNTRKEAAGAHTITTKASDVSGNVDTDTITVYK